MKTSILCTKKSWFNDLENGVSFILTLRAGNLIIYFFTFSLPIMLVAAIDLSVWHRFPIIGSGSPVDPVKIPLPLSTSSFKLGLMAEKDGRWQFYFQLAILEICVTNFNGCFLASYVYYSPGKCGSVFRLKTIFKNNWQPPYYLFSHNKYT